MASMMGPIWWCLGRAHHRVLGVSSLLNPDEETVDILPLIQDLASFSTHEQIRVPLDIRNHLKLALDHLHSTLSTPSSTRELAVPTFHFQNPNDNLQRESEQHVKLNRETVLETLFRYPVRTVVEYPETSSTGFIGHLFAMDPEDWSNPIQNVVYSRGKPSGQTIAGHEVYVELLKYPGSDDKVPFWGRYPPGLSSGGSTLGTQLGNSASTGL
ncbi:hypothetical protein R3P38DRAFT_3204539 [Favolaschia claudopus]|uniref:Uncharacterized protein n=1 Tax=Favolaschia claudopus TaxID=2862362 RepID=A0AAW0AQD8_9AGAR